MSLCYDGMDIRLHRYIDSDFAGDVDGQKSTLVMSLHWKVEQ